MKRTSTLLAAFAIAAASPAGAAVFAHYSFDTDYSDSSGNGRHGTLSDGTTAGDSSVTATDHVFGGGSMSFSSDRDYIAIPSQTFGTGTAYTIGFWAKKAPGDTGGAAQWDMAIGERGNTNFFIALNDASGTGGRDGIRWRSNNTAGGTRQADFAAPDDNEWHHYTISADSSKNLSFYLDGALVETLANVETGFIFDTIGEAYVNTSDFDMHGLMDEVWIFDEALDATQVSNLRTYNSLVPEPSASLLASLGVVAFILRRRRA